MNTISPSYSPLTTRLIQFRCSFHRLPRRALFAVEHEHTPRVPCRGKVEPTMSRPGCSQFLLRRRATHLPARGIACRPRPRGPPPGTPGIPSAPGSTSHRPLPRISPSIRRSKPFHSAMVDAHPSPCGRGSVVRPSCTGADVANDRLRHGCAMEVRAGSATIPGTVPAYCRPRQRDGALRAAYGPVVGTAGGRRPGRLDHTRSSGGLREGRT